MIKQLIILIILTGTLLGSGSRPQKPGKPPRNPDIVKYNSGKALFTGKKQLPQVNPDLRKSQLRVLQEIENVLPKTAKKKYSVLPLAGRLTEKEIEVLKYYLSIRYKIKKF